MTRKPQVTIDYDGECALVVYTTSHDVPHVVTETMDHAFARAVRDEIRRANAPTLKAAYDAMGWLHTRRDASAAVRDRLACLSARQGRVG